MAEDRDADAIFTDTFSGLTMYYRDTIVPESLYSGYKVGQLLKEESFIAMSYTAGRLTKPLRFAIASNKAVDQSLETPEAARWGVYRLDPNAHFKVLDIYKIEDQAQIFLLHIPEDGLELFYPVNTNMEEKLIEKARLSFDQKLQGEIIPVLEEEHWVAISEFPIGMNDDGSFLPIRPLDDDFRKRMLGV